MISFNSLAIILSPFTHEEAGHSVYKTPRPERARKWYDSSQHQEGEDSVAKVLSAQTES